MTSLKVLDVGMEHRNQSFRPGRLMIQRGAQFYIEFGDHFPDTLKLSLTLGLDSLATLEKLELFGF